MHARPASAHCTSRVLVLMLAFGCGLPARAGDIARGQRLLTQYQCGACHAIPGVEDARGRAGPPLEKFGRRTYIAGHIPNQMGKLVQWIVEPRALVPDTTMPDMGVSQNDARDMAAYLNTLK
ncbi:MAG TPA: c-type cytochrome [Oxalicibacterium sp.]|nr:c-type cytochrome [Oxalicibacterium sp.]